MIRKAEQAVSDLKTQFNKDLINIYFSCIIGHLQSAQEQVATAVTNEGNSLTAYQSNLLQPLGAYSQSFAGIKSSPDSILSTYSSFNDALNHTNEIFSSIINVDKTYDTELSAIQEAQTKWQTSIEQREQNLAQYDESLSKLLVVDQLQQLQTVKTTFNDGLSNPTTWDETITKSQGINADIDKLTGFNTTIQEVLSSHEQKIADAVEESLGNTNGILAIQLQPSKH